MWDLPGPRISLLTTGAPGKNLLGFFELFANPSQIKTIHIKIWISVSWKIGSAGTCGGLKEYGGQPCEMRYPSSDLLQLPLISIVSPVLRMKRGPVVIYHHTCAVIFLMLWERFPTSILSQRWWKWNADWSVLCLHIFYHILSVSSLLYFLNEDVSVFLL